MSLVTTLYMKRLERGLREIARPAEVVPACIGKVVKGAVTREGFASWQITYIQRETETKQMSGGSGTGGDMPLWKG